MMKKTATIQNPVQKIWISDPVGRFFDTRQQIGSEIDKLEVGRK